MHQMLSIAVWAFFAVSLVMVSLSRLYVAAHFPHQCLFGAIIGKLSKNLMFGFTYIINLYENIIKILKSSKM